MAQYHGTDRGIFKKKLDFSFTKTNVLIIRSNPCNPDSRVEKIATSLSKLRTHVSVLAWDRDGSTDSNESRPGYHIHRVGIKASYGAGLANIVPMIKFQYKTLVYLWKNRANIDAIHACDFDTALPAFCIAKLCKKILIYDIFDYYVDTFSVPKKLKPIIKEIENFIINHADACIICSDSRLKQIAPATPKKQVIIHNAPKKPKTLKVFKLKNSKRHRIKIAYVGSLSPHRYIKELLELVQENHLLELHIAGFGVLQDMVEHYAKESDNIEFYGKICYEDTLALENACDILTALYNPDITNHIYAAPNKFYESLFLGKPVVMIRGTGMSEYVLNYKLGEVIDFSKENLLQACIRLVETNTKDLEKKRKYIYETQFSWDIMEQKLFGIYKDFFPLSIKKLIAIVFGTRPEAIKLAPLIKELQGKNNFLVCNILSNQHTESMLQPILQAFGVRAHFNLHVHHKFQTLHSISSKILDRLSPLLAHIEPDLVCVHGDTTTAYVGALTSFYQHIPIAHIEAGLRTYNLRAPFPEEFNRQSIALIADYHFTPTTTTKTHLLAEHIPEKNIFVVGNTAIDALRITISKGFTHPLLDWLENDLCLLLTAHRRENLGSNLKHIFTAINNLLEAIPNLKVIYPIHPNPSIQDMAQKYLKSQKRLRIIPPLDVIAFHNLLHRADIILTDSGGIQEEAPALHKPVLVLRETTERVEGLEAGTLKLVGTDPSSIFQATYDILHIKTLYREMASKTNPYGNGTSSRQIVAALENIFNNDEDD